jgi:hypothetical protein
MRSGGAASRRAEAEPVDSVVEKRARVRTGLAAQGLDRYSADVAVDSSRLRFPQPVRAI